MFNPKGRIGVWAVEIKRDGPIEQFKTDVDIIKPD